MTLTKGTTLYWSLFSHDNWKMYVAATDQGLCFVGSHNQPLEELKKWANRHHPEHQLVLDDERLQPFVDELVLYIQGKLSQFAIPVSYHGTPFQKAVWKAVWAIPFGQTVTYSELAQKLQKPSAVRAIGRAVGANPLLITVPCHRVIGKNGSLTGYRGGLDMKTKLLALEREALNKKKELCDV
ncbi:O6-methylguanine-DNA methyltransferase [Fictibacillus macauensis ZFHKF-1]|uniref:methylated-DNA--[protein]-cysteine S-methyltransferase n=1 Tax=Fictibacillus macauensis ZFHKF-1 TaxID=1196324 RepID=I8ADT5_9BACL|nr:methylated-DNA--[protein]-cysteine S-methyltransferase [Fictibacillus macauensis]EIT83742.1 O6-methylguanine-DNA methyltransferase [Fictibacillus macauensis ZFHKF-1]